MSRSLHGRGVDRLCRSWFSVAGSLEGAFQILPCEEGEVGGIVSVGNKAGAFLEDATRGLQHAEGVAALLLQSVDTLELFQPVVALCCELRAGSDGDVELSKGLRPGSDLVEGWDIAIPGST